MTRQIIAKVKLTPGQGGFFDPVSRVHLTHGSPVADIYAGTNTEGLKKALRNRTISLVSGSLGEQKSPFKLVRKEDGKVVLVRTDNVNKTTVEEVKTVTAKVAPRSKKQEIKEAEKDATPVAIKSTTVKKADLAAPLNVPAQQKESKIAKEQQAGEENNKVAETKPAESVTVTAVASIEKKGEKSLQHQTTTGYDYSRNKKKDKNKNEKE